MAIIRFNTIVFNFKAVGIIPDLDFHRWVRALGVKDGEFKVADFGRYKREGTIKFIDNNRFREFTEKIKMEELGFRVGEETREVKYSILDGYVRVIIRDVPAEVDLKELANLLGGFGELGGLEWEGFDGREKDYFATAHKQVLRAKIKLNKNIPNYIYLKGDKFNVTYNGQPPFCHYCHTNDHTKQECQKWQQQKEAWETEFPALGPKNKTEIWKTVGKGVTPTVAKKAKRTEEPSRSEDESSEDETSEENEKETGQKNEMKKKKKVRRSEKELRDRRKNMDNIEEEIMEVASEEENPIQAKEVVSMEK